jgi:hypothetical protein
MVNLQNIFVMDVFVVQTYPVTVGSCFHYPLQGIMDHFHQGFHSLEMVMESIVNCLVGNFQVVEVPLTAWTVTFTC